MDDDLKAILEAVLFVSPEPVSAAAMKKLHGQAGVAEWKQAATELMAEYESRDGAIRVIEIADGYKMVTRQELAPWIRKFTKATASARLSRAGLETLSIVAYRQPVIKAEIDAIRGVSSDGVLKTLLDRKLVKILGRKEMPGRPLLYGTTREFLEHFGLKTIAEMPTIKDLEEVPVEPSLLPEEAEDALDEALPSASWPTGEDEQIDAVEDDLPATKENVEAVDPEDEGSGETGEPSGEAAAEETRKDPGQ